MDKAVSLSDSWSLDGSRGTSPLEVRVLEAEDAESIDVVDGCDNAEELGSDGCNDELDDESCEVDEVVVWSEDEAWREDEGSEWARVTEQVLGSDMGEEMDADDGKPWEWEIKRWFETAGTVGTVGTASSEDAVDWQTMQREAATTRKGPTEAIGEVQVTEVELGDEVEVSNGTADGMNEDKVEEWDMSDECGKLEWGEW